MPRKIPEDEVFRSEPATNIIKESDYGDVENNREEIVSTNVTPAVPDIRLNPFKKWIYLAEAIDSWRPFPRIFISIYIYILYRVVEWYLLLIDPTMEQSGLISVIVGAGAAWFGLYVGSGGRGGK
jgi:hypothetical protein